MTLPIIPRGPIFNRDLFDKFAANVPTFGKDEPLDPIFPRDVFVVRKMYHGEELLMPDGKEVEVWGFEDDIADDGPMFPSKTIRLKEGQLFHGRLEARHGPHSIHWHGIEPTPCNDGVGHF